MPRDEFDEPVGTPWWARCMLGLYALVLGAVVVGLYGFGDRTWWGTALLFGPRWLWALPLPLVALVAILWCRWWMRGVALGAILLWFFGIWGFVIPIERLRGTPVGESLRVLTCNLADGLTHYPSLARLLLEAAPDLAAFQETGPELEKHLPEGWRSIRIGKVVVASRYPLRPRVGDSQFYALGIVLPIGNLVEIETPAGKILFAAVHFDSPRQGLLRILDRQTVIDPSRRGYLEWLTELRSSQQRRVRRRIDHELGGLPLIVAGDFNTPVESRLYREVWGDLHNAFSQAGWGPGESIYVAIRELKYGARIDHILHDDRWRCGQAWIGPWIGSDHRPLLADLWLQAAE